MIFNKIYREEKDKITVGGYHSKNRDIIINLNIKAAKVMLKVTNSIFGEDLNLA